jgi:hypothetical protein
LQSPRFARNFAAHPDDAAAFVQSDKISIFHGCFAKRFARRQYYALNVVPLKRAAINRCTYDLKQRAILRPLPTMTLDILARRWNAICRNGNRYMSIHLSARCMIVPEKGRQ